MNARVAKTYDAVGPWERHFAICPVDSWTGTGYRKRWLCWVERRVMWSAGLMDGFEEFRDISRSDQEVLTKMRPDLVARSVNHVQQVLAPSPGLYWTR